MYVCMYVCMCDSTSNAEEFNGQFKMALGFYVVVTEILIADYCSLLNKYCLLLSYDLNYVNIGLGINNVWMSFGLLVY